MPSLTSRHITALEHQNDLMQQQRDSFNHSKLQTTLARIDGSLTISPVMGKLFSEFIREVLGHVETRIKRHR